MFASIHDSLGSGLPFLVLGIALSIRLAMKHPGASGGIARGIFGLLFRK